MTTATLPRRTYMISTGLFAILALLAAVALQVGCGLRFDGWPGILAGAAGIAYCYLATPSLGLLPIFFTSAAILLYGVLGAIARLWRRRS